MKRTFSMNETNDMKDYILFQIRNGKTVKIIPVVIFSTDEVYITVQETV